MVYRCDVSNCPNSSNKTKGIRYHSLPSDENKRKSWLNEINQHGGFRKSKKKTTLNCDNIVICGEHFTPDSYESLIIGANKRLCPNAIPSLFPDNIERNRCSPSKKRKTVLDNTTGQAGCSEDGSSAGDPCFSEMLDSQGALDPILISPVDVFSEVANISTTSKAVKKLPKKRKKKEYNKTCVKPCSTNFASQDKVAKARKMIDKKNLVIKRQKSEIKRKNDKIKILTEKLEGFDDIDRKIMDNIIKLTKQEELRDTYASIIMDQLRNYGKKTGARWNQETIKNCIILQGRSSSSYKYLRKSGMIHWPSPSTLRAYTGKSTGEIGFTHLVEQRLKSEARTLNDMEKLGSLQVDEMTIKPKEKYNRNFGRYFGRVDMGNIVKDNTRRLANKVLAFVFSGLTTRFHIPVAIYMVNQLTAEQQKKLTVYVIQQLEIYGFRVIRLVTDNLSVNVKMFSLFNDGVTCPVVKHPVDLVADSLQWPCVYRPLFLSYDPCHVIKNVRNQFIDRHFIIANENVTFQLVRDIYEKQTRENDLVKPVRFLTRVHVNPNNLERQRVKPAVDIFREEVPGTIIMNKENRVEGFQDVEGTVKFLQMFNKWFACHDVSNTTEGIRKRLLNKMPFISADDTRLDWLMKDFLSYIQIWQQDVSKRVNAIPLKSEGSKQKRKEEKKTGFTKETYDALQFTTISTVSATQYLLDLGFAFVLTRRYSSDDVELFFSAVRQMMGGNFQGDAYGVLTGFEKILRTGIAHASINSNVILRRETPREYELLRAERTTRKSAKSELTFLPSSFLLVLDELLIAPTLPESTSEVATVAYLGGYCLYILKEWEFCSECISKLEQEKTMSPHLSYIRNLDRGGLLYPSDEFIARLWTIYNFTKAVIPVLEGCQTILKDMTQFLIPKVENCSTFQCELSQSKEKNTEFIECVLKKFLMPLLRNKCIVPTADNTVNIDTATKNRRLKTLKQ